MTKGSNNAVKFFVDYVAARNLSIMTKTEWEQLYFYCSVRHRFKQKQLINLTTEELYTIGEKLELDFSKVNQLVKKCYRFECEDARKLNFHELFEQSAIINPNMENKNVKFGITNSLVQERIEEILNKAGIFSDSSYKKNIFTIPTVQFLTLIEKENQSLFTKFQKMKDDFIKKIKDCFSKGKESKMNDLQELINNEDAKTGLNTLVELAKSIAGILNISANSVAELIMKTVKSEDSVLTVMSDKDFSNV